MIDWIEEEKDSVVEQEDKNSRVKNTSERVINKSWIEGTKNFDGVF